MKENYTIRKIDEHTWQLEDWFHTYMYLLEGQDRAMLIDAGNGFSGLKEAVQKLTKKPIDVLLTHGHFDHTGGAAEFDRCYIQKEDIQVLKEGFDPESRLEFWNRFCELYQVELSETEKNFFLSRQEPKKTDEVTEGMEIELGGRKLIVLEVPGHTRGSVAVLDQKYGYLFSGDTACNREILVYFDHSGTVRQVLDSAGKLLSLKQNFNQIWPGHHECPMDETVLEDYREAAKRILENPGAGKKIKLQEGFKQLYCYKTIGISYTEDHIG